MKTFSSRLSQGHYGIRDLKLEDPTIMKSFGLGQFKSVVEAYTIENGENIRVMSYDFFSTMVNELALLMSTFNSTLLLDNVCGGQVSKS